ncbi:MAG TPA: hypothetical protein VGS80_24635, partial [Ktedonobacterales bacterium]|nr:hypothetical protein [Ktedonobacterales bacterium]
TSVDAWYFMLVLALRNVLLAIVALRALLHTGHARKAAAPVPDASAEQSGPAAQSSPLASACYPLVLHRHVCLQCP